jgi:mannose/fructose/N-acetylgalactosamine-specific phosphotransferase system component IID
MGLCSGLSSFKGINVKLLLKLLAVVLGLFIVAVIIAKRSNISIGVRTGHNNFTELIANVSVLTWLLVLLILIELTVCAVLLFSSMPRI